MGIFSVYTQVQQLFVCNVVKNRQNVIGIDDDFFLHLATSRFISGVNQIVCYRQHDFGLRRVTLVAKFNFRHLIQDILKLGFARLERLVELVHLDVINVEQQLVAIDAKAL